MIQMDAGKKRLVVLAGAAATLAVCVVLVFGGRDSSVSESASADGVGGSTVGLLDSRPQHLADVARVARSRQRQPYDARATRDPMVALVRERSVAPVPEPADPGPTRPVRPPVRLDGIIWDESDPTALMGGNPYRVGDTVLGAKITEIDKESVTISYKGRLFVLTVE